MSMKAMLEKLPDDNFIRVHRSFIISIQKITAYTNRDVEIAGIEIPIGRLYAASLQKIAAFNK